MRPSLTSWLFLAWLHLLFGVREAFEIGVGLVGGWSDIGPLGRGDLPSVAFFVLLLVVAPMVAPYRTRPRSPISTTR